MQRIHLGFFVQWAAERGITEPAEVTRTVLESYQRHVFHYRKKNGEPLSFTSQQDRLVPLRMWFRWMARQHHILHNPASELELPRLGFRLPNAVLTAEEAELIMAQTNYPRSPRPARSRHPRDVLLDRNAAARTGASEAVGSSTLERSTVDHPPGQGQEGPHHSAGRPRRGVGAQVPRASRGRNW